MAAPRGPAKLLVDGVSSRTGAPSTLVILTVAVLLLAAASADPSWSA